MRGGVQEGVYISVVEIVSDGVGRVKGATDETRQDKTRQGEDGMEENGVE